MSNEINVSSVNSSSNNINIIPQNNQKQLNVHHFLQKGDKGDKGDQGVGIVSVNLISTLGLKKTYRMTFSDNTYFDFDVNDGASGLANWGSIQGSIMLQSDLIDLLNLKVPEERTINGHSLESNITLSASDVGALSSSTIIPSVGNGQITISQNGETKGSFSVNQTTNSLIEIDAGSSRNIGEIVASTIPLTDAGLHLLDGSLIQGSGIYSDFVDYIAGIYDPTANYFCTEVEWQTAVTTYGVCGKFVYDSVNNTVRLPKYNSKIYTGGGTAPVVGNGISLGLTDGTYNGGLSVYNNRFQADPQLYGSGIGLNSRDWTFSGKSTGITTDPTKSGIIAQISNITTLLDGYYYIGIATSTKTDIQVDIDEIATDLNGKADVDLSNCTKPHIVETYVNGTSWYRVYSDGWCEQGGEISLSGNAWQTVSFLKHFKDANYQVLTSLGYHTTGGMEPIIYNNKTTISVQILSDNQASRKFTWQASGYIN